MQWLPMIIGIHMVVTELSSGLEIGWVPLGFVLVSTCFFGWWALRYRRVSLDGTVLLISCRSGDLRVPLSRVTAVRCLSWLNTKDITIVFDRDIGIGNHVTFIPKIVYMGVGSFAEHPMAEELRLLAGLG